VHLIPQQRVLLDYLIAYIGEHRYSPTYQEIARHFGYRSLSTVYEHLQKLANKGLIRTEYMKRRSIELVEMQEAERAYQPVFPPRDWLRERCDERRLCPFPESVQVSLMGVRRYREGWDLIKGVVQPGDQLWTFCSPPESWKQGCGRAGYAIVRDNLLADGLLVWDEMTEPERITAGAGEKIGSSSQAGRDELQRRRSG
jgi:hypothetical protein